MTVLGHGLCSLFYSLDLDYGHLLALGILRNRKSLISMAASADICWHLVYFMLVTQKFTLEHQLVLFFVGRDAQVLPRVGESQAEVRH